MADQIELSARVKTDGEGDEYYVVVSDMPVMVDLAKTVVFVFHPREGEDFAKIVFRPRFGGKYQPKSMREPREGGRPEDGTENG